MATWFAQNSTVDIDSVNQWNSAANGSGSWLTWASLGAADILVANGKTSITINVNVTCATITTAATGGTAGGGFILNDVTVTASLVTGTTNVITFSANAPAVANVIGNQTAGGSQFRRCVLHSGSGTLTMTGNLEGGLNNENNTVELSGSGVLNVTGNLGTVAAVQSGADAIRHSGAGTINLTGNITGTFAAGISRNGTGAIYVTGSVTGGSTGTTGAGILSTTTSLIKVTGTLTAGSLAPAVSSTGTVVVCGNQVAASNGRLAVYAPTVLIDSSIELQHTYRRDVSGSAGTARTMYTGGVNLGQPVVANVRSLITFGAASEYTGTLVVASPTFVAIGVATDNTVGSYAPTGGLDAAGVRTAIGLGSANLDTQLSGLQSDTNDIQTRLQAAIAAIDAGGSGTGARTVTITVNDGTTVLQNATVRMTEGANTFTSLTNASGVAVFNLDDATHAVSITKSGYSYAGTTLVVNGTETATYSMTVVSITPPSNPSLSAIVVLCLDAAGQPEAAVAIDIRIVTVPSGSQNIAYKGAKQTATSNGNGIAQFQVVRGSVCEWKRGKADVWSSVTIDSDSVTNVTSVIGSP